jgi:5-methylcytosine-specific restriction endonuclease McrA
MSEPEVKALTKKERAELREMFGGHCAYCGDVLPQTGWHADHVEPVYRETVWVNGYLAAGGEYVRGRLKKTGKSYQPQNHRLDNLMPSCRKCNCSKNSYTLESWRRILSEQPRMCHDYSHNFRWAVKFGLVTVNNVPVVFYFERVAQLDATP